MLEVVIKYYCHRFLRLYYLLYIPSVLFSEGYANITMTMLYYGNEAGATGAHFPFNFDFITDVSSESNARDFVYVILKWLTYMPFGAVPNWVVSSSPRK